MRLIHPLLLRLDPAGSAPSDISPSCLAEHYPDLRPKGLELCLANSPLGLDDSKAHVMNRRTLCSIRQSCLSFYHFRLWT